MVLALNKLGFNSELLKHGIKREVFLFPLVLNLKECIEEQDNEPLYLDRSFNELAEYWRNRWLLGRADRVDGWHSWEKKRIIDEILFPLKDTFPQNPEESVNEEGLPSVIKCDQTIPIQMVENRMA